MAKKLISIDDTAAAGSRLPFAVRTELSGLYAPTSIVGRLGAGVPTLVDRLNDGIEPATLAVVGDSTGDELTEWVYLLAQWLATKFPAYTFLYRKFSDASQSYPTPAVLSTGTAGRGYATLGGPGQFLLAPDSPAVSVTGDFDFRMRLALDSWTGASGYLASKYGPSDGSRGWRFGINSNGNLNFDWSPTGNAPVAQKISTAVVDAAAGAAKWVRVAHDVDDGASGNTVTFYTSDDGFNWTQLGATITTAGTTGHFDNTNGLEIGARTGGADRMPPGKVYAAELRNGIDGPIVASIDLGDFTAGTTMDGGTGEAWGVNGTPVMGGARNVTVLNGSIGGQTIAYSIDNTRFPKQIPRTPALLFISYGHNEGATKQYIPAYRSFIDKARTTYPGVGIVCMTQNPRKAPAAFIVEHAIRNRQIAQVARIDGHDLGDVYRAWINAGSPPAWFNADGIHPEVGAGRAAVAEVAKGLFTPIIGA